jgi:hypothetical protein
VIDRKDGRPQVRGVAVFARPLSNDNRRRYHRW